MIEIRELNFQNKSGSLTLAAGQATNLTCYHLPAYQIPIA